MNEKTLVTLSPSPLAVVLAPPIQSPSPTHLTLSSLTAVNTTAR